ncbi:Uncharacterised protein [Phocoenobacter uteri]|uniref:Transporter suffix domain-containing protein n=1 Tax=Phocoenobacter uteri TaxID=146806 RepID=A0A379CAB9_9PAST|nr:transporter suffix domain-containing protein [Phocoenobacter uteri]MDG6882475.1 hypothetical protein [Phocoenobacter uteri]SUB58636.1 Uncharacterised protein [Phocoenobacter uteri]
MKKTIGYTLFILSWLAWGVIALLPFFDLSTAMVATMTTIMLILGEIFFWVSTLLLGSEFMAAIKGFFKKVTQTITQWAKTKRE